MLKRRRDQKNGIMYIGKYRLSITLSEEAKNKLEEISAYSEMSYSKTIEYLILKKKIQKKDKMASLFSLELARFRTELNKIGNNINQIAKNSNAAFKAHEQDKNDYYWTKTSNYFYTIELILNKVLELQEQAYKKE